MKSRDGAFVTHHDKARPSRRSHVTRDEDQRLEVARFRGDHYSAERDGDHLVVYATTAGMDAGDTRDEMTNGVGGGGPRAATEAQERQFNDRAHRSRDAQTGLIAKINEKNRQFWARANGGGR